MERYEVRWKDTLIGVLCVNGEEHMYEAYEEAIKNLKDVPFDPAVTSSREWGKKIPFFASRLESCKRFPDLEIGFQTDFYRLRKI